MNFIISTPCTCILDKEPNVCDVSPRWGSSIKKADRKYRLVRKKKKGYYEIVKGNEDDDEEIVWEKTMIKSVWIEVEGVDVTLDRRCCEDVLELHVCRGSCIWLQHFDDIFPEMNVFCEGKITSLDYGYPFIVKNLNIHMDPDYHNQSSVENFQVVEHLNIKYQYNGIISGVLEQTCDCVKPFDECKGKAAHITLRTLTKSQQRKLNEYRRSEGYIILTSQLNGNKKEPHTIYSGGQTCAKCDCLSNEYWLSPCQHRLCYDCIERLSTEQHTHFQPPYFVCPNINCRKNVMDIHQINYDVNQPEDNS